MDNKYSEFKSKLKYNSTHLDCKECTKLTGQQDLLKKFVRLSSDEETDEFIHQCHNSKFQIFKSSYIIPFLTK